MQISHAQGQLLAQVRPSVTTPILLFQGLQLRTEVTLILITLDSGTADLSIFHDDAGVSWVAATKIIFSQRALTSDSRLFQAQHPGSGIMLKAGGSLGIQCSVASVLTASVYGITESVAERIRGSSNG